MSPRTLLFCFLLLAGLLAADILTTVWFWSLGMLELNPAIAPIAGDPLAQVQYKIPFVAALLVGVLVLSRGCERLRPQCRRSGISCISRHIIGCGRRRGYINLLMLSFFVYANNGESD